MVKIKGWKKIDDDQWVSTNIYTTHRLSVMVGYTGVVFVGNYGTNDKLTPIYRGKNLSDARKHAVEYMKAHTT